MTAGGVRTGADVLAGEQFARLSGMRVGLVTNHTGVTASGTPTVDALHRAPGVRLTKLFSPEHGIRGRLDENVPDGRDEATGLPVFSLYGARSRPTDEQLHGLDALLYDIQDIGCRFYTYISTLGLCLEAAHQAGVRFIVLDRPNPLGGFIIEGPVADTDKLSFTAYHTLPVRHGMTVGELAQLFGAEKRTGAKLEVIHAEGWSRSMYWDATGLAWINPSPNMRSFTEALLYPGVGLLESTNVSVGRGTDTPFEVVGAPWMDGRQIAADLNSEALPGVRFIPVHFTPHSSVHSGKPCGGVNIVITERHRFVPVLTGMAIAAAILRRHRTHWESSSFNRLLVNDEAYRSFMHGQTAEQLSHAWTPQIEAFRERRSHHLLYE